MSEYTPEPWENHIGTIESESGWHIASCVTTNGGKATANAARIVACVNAMAGIDDPAAEIAKLRAEREELIKLADLWDQQCGRESFAPNFADELRAALAKVKGE